MCEQCNLSSDPKDVAAISHVVDMLANSQQRDVADNVEVFKKVK